MAGASFHGGFLATHKPDSPHLLAPQIKARLYFAIAADDDRRSPEVKHKLKAAFAAAQVRAADRSLPPSAARLVRARQQGGLQPGRRRSALGASS